MERGYLWLVIVAVINTVMAAYYYLYVVIVMFFREPKEEISLVPLPRAFVFTLIVTILGVFYFGLLPTRVFEVLSAAQGMLAIWR
jgi:NADH-quinone oxidoreductase subunit N